MGSDGIGIAHGKSVWRNLNGFDEQLGVSSSYRDPPPKQQTTTVLCADEKSTHHGQRHVSAAEPVSDWSAMDALRFNLKGYKM